MVNNPLHSLYEVARVFRVCGQEVAGWCGRVFDRSVADEECLLVCVDMATLLAPAGHQHTPGSL